MAVLPRWATRTPRAKSTTRASTNLLTHSCLDKCRRYQTEQLRSQMNLLQTSFLNKTLSRNEDHEKLKSQSIIPGQDGEYVNPKPSPPMIENLTQDSRPTKPSQYLSLEKPPPAYEYVPRQYPESRTAGLRIDVRCNSSGIHSG